MNKNYEPHHSIKLMELTRLYQNEEVNQGDRGTSKQVILLNKKEEILRIIVRGDCKGWGDSCTVDQASYPSRLQKAADFGRRKSRK